MAGPVDRITYQQARRLKNFKPAEIGMPLGPEWATFWFRAQATIPKEWDGRRVDLLWITYGENTLWLGGQSRQGLNFSLTYGHPPPPQRAAAPLVGRARAGERMSFEIESACNGLFGQEKSQPYAHVSPYVLDKAEIALFDPRAFELYHDLRVLVDLEAESQDPETRDLDAAWAGLLLGELNHFCNACDPDDPGTWAQAGQLLKRLYDYHNGAAVHEISAIGHAHIDTAWLWPVAETHRKIERSWSTVLRLMEEYPDFRFASSQAYQYEVIRQRNPALYVRIKAAHQRGQWYCVGGTWIESDCNLPSGESLIRQFLYGQRFFEREFGGRCGEMWAPDVFGACAQLPQVMRHCGVDRFLTSKFSWNRFNKPDHHTFTWEGIDGSAVLAHYLPSDTYNTTVTIEQMRRNARSFRNHDLGHDSLMVFGYGDGGGGPDETMLETIRRARDLQGLPRTVMRSPDEFFARIATDAIEHPRYVGELYLELHRGTYTTHAATKRANRKCEIALHDAEFLCAVASEAAGHEYPAVRLEELWRLVLLNQFHDILPGSSIGEVYEQAQKEYVQVLAGAGELRDSALRALGSKRSGRRSAGAFTPLNTTGFARREVIELPGAKLGFVETPPYGFGATAEPRDAVVVRELEGAGDPIVLENDQLAATFSASGRLLSLVHKPTGREAIAPGCAGNDLELYDDRPVAHDAWDIDPFHIETRRPVGPAEEVSRLEEQLPLRGGVRFVHKVGRSSRIVVVARLDAESERLEFHCEADWREDHKLLKVAFALDVRSMAATYEIPFGALDRPTHFNTSFDAAKFEVPAQRWADLSEPGFGVALLNDCKYGYSAYRNVLRLSLLRAPTYPDPAADRGMHRFAYALYPHAGMWHESDVVAQAARFNQPPVPAPGALEPRSFLHVDSPHLVLDTVKRAEEGDGLVLRLYECHGARGTARLRMGLPVASACLCNGLEDDGPPLELAGEARDEIVLPFTPFQVLSLKLAEEVTPRGKTRSRPKSK